MTRFNALLLTVLTGFSGLVYEVAWQKYVATLLGSHAEATAAVLAIFLGGLSAGYAIFGVATRRLVERARRSGRPPRLLLFYGLVESGIGLYCLLFPALFGIAQSVSLLVPLEHAAIGFAFDVVLTALLIGPPAVLMGGTIPVLTLALAGDLQHATRVHAWIYGFNTVGAFAGALAGGFFLIPLLGLDGVVYTMGAVNLLAGASFALLDRIGERVAPELEETAPSPVAVEGFASYAAVALLGGFAMMAVQTTLNRIGGLAFGASHFTFAMVVAVFVLSIAIGSLAVSALPRIPRSLIVGSQWALVLFLLLLYQAMPAAPYWAHVIRVTFRPVDPAFYPFYYLAFTAMLAVLVIPIGLAGALLPLLFHHLRREVGDLGSVAGRLYSWNTVGSLLGALLGGYVLLFWLDLHHVYRVAVAATIVGASILTVRVFRVPPLLTAVLVVLPALVALSTFSPWDPEKLTAGLFRKREPGPASFKGPDAIVGRRNMKVIFHRDGPTSTVTVKEGKSRDGELSRSIITNGKPDGNLVGDYATMALTALIPALLVDDPERSFVIGYGTGVTAGELAALEKTRTVEVAEIAHGVIAAAPLFDMGNLEASKNPKVTIIRGDAYRTLLRTEGQYDLILSEPSNPWVTGVEMLYSVEFLEAARKRLAPGGVYGQWFHLYELDRETVALVLRTYASVFPHVSVWYTMGADLLLLGLDRPEHALDLRAIEARFRRPDFAAGFARVEIESFPVLLAHELLPAGVLHASGSTGALHTLRHPILSHRAARAFFKGRIAQLPKYARPAGIRAGAQNSLLRRYAGGGGNALPEVVLEQVVRETCKRTQTSECATLFARWKLDHPESARLRAALEEGQHAMPGVLTDEKIDALVPLFGGGRPADLPGDTPLARAQNASTNFIQHYHHAAPFDRRVLAAAWNRCTHERCQEPRSRVEARLGRLAKPGGPSLRRSRRSPSDTTR